MTHKNNKSCYSRRGDKILEACYVNLNKYMEEAELWFRKYEMTHPPTRRRIYLATDEPQVKDKT